MPEPAGLKTLIVHNIFDLRAKDFFWIGQVFHQVGPQEDAATKMSPRSLRKFWEADVR